MSSIDERIVEMTFKSTSFLQNVNTVISALSKLKSSLNLGGAEKSLNDLDAAGKRFSLSSLESSASTVASKFSAMSVLGISALATIASKAVTAGISLVKAFTIDPIKAGLDVYETKINAIQTILANTQSEGTNLSQVTAALNQLNTYANQTVYNFGQMAKNIGTFTAAGVDLKTSVASIKGIANLAALSGSSAEQASTAMYQLSQAIANGKVNLQDWNSVVNAGLGGKVFQNALEQTAKATGVNIDAIIKKAGSFRNSLQQGWLTSKILTQTLETFTGDLSAQQLRSMGYTAAQTQAIIKQAQAAKNSATQIKTITQLHQALAEEVATAWSQVWEALIGNIGDATKTLTAVHNTLENAFTTPVKDLAALLQQWDKLGGRAAVIQGIVNIFHALQSVLDPIKQAFQDIFPPATAANLVSLSKGFETLTSHLILSKTASNDVRDIFLGLFSAVKIVVDVLVDVVKGFSGVGSAASSGVGGVASLAARFGDFLNHILQVVEGGGKLTTFLTGIGKVLSAPIRLVGLLGGALGGLGGVFDAVIKKVEPFASKVGAAFGQLGSAIAKGISSGNFSNVLNLLNQGLFALILLQVKKFFANLTKSAGKPKIGLFDTIKESFEGLTTTLKAMQTNLKSGTLLKIAGAVGILTASVVALSFINAGKLSKALAAITLMFTELLSGMAIVSKIAGTSGIIEMPVIAASLNLLATAILILAGAVAILSTFSWQGLAKGLGSIAVLLAELSGAMKLMSGDSKGLVASAYSMQIMAVALNLLAAAVGKLGKMNFGTLAKGIGSITALLIVVAGFQKLGGGANMISTAVSMVILGAAINIIAIAVENLGKMSWESIAKGLTAMAGSLVILSAATILMEASLPGAAALLVASAALVILAQAMQSLGGMSWDAIAKSLIELAGSLVIIAAALILMEGSLPGAAALIIVAGALAILTPALIALGQLSWGELLTSLGALAGVFLILGAAGLLLGPLVPVLIGLGVAIALIGVGVLAAGVGVLAFGVGLTALAAAVTASGLAITAFVSSILGLIPLAFAQLGHGIINLANIIGQGGPAIERAFEAIITALLNAVIHVTPKIGQAIQVILTTVLNLINRNTPAIINTMTTLVLRLLNAISSRAGQFANAGANAIISVLNGITRNVPRIATAGGNLVIAFINAIGAQGARIAAAGVRMVINFVNNVANSIRSNTGAMRSAGANLASAIIEGMVAGIEGGIGAVISAAKSLASSALHSALNTLHINSPSKDFILVGEGTGEGMVVGMQNSIKPVSDGATEMASVAIDSMKAGLSGLSDAINSNIDLQPTITPVIDLTQAQQGFSALANLTKDQLITAAATTNKATSISAENAAAAEEAGLATSSGSTYNFTQNNTSPKALSTADIYRQTKNQLSVVKGALPK